MSKTIIEIEGIDSTGKSTVINSLKEEFPKSISFIKTPTPQFRSFIIDRNEPLPFEIATMLFSIDRWHSVQNTYDIIIADRFLLSTLAYHAKDDNAIKKIIGMHNSLSIPMPAISFLLISNKNVIIDRLSKRKNTDIYEKDIKKLISIQDRYIDIVEKIPYHCYTIDTSKLSQEKVIKKIKSLTNQDLCNILV